jgi:hypothetical protein
MRAGTDVWIRWQDVVHRLHVEECQPAESIQIVEVRLEVDLLPAPHSGREADVRAAAIHHTRDPFRLIPARCGPCLVPFITNPPPGDFPQLQRVCDLQLDSPHEATVEANHYTHFRFAPPDSLDRMDLRVVVVR